MQPQQPGQQMPNPAMFAARARPGARDTQPAADQQPCSGADSIEEALTGLDGLDALPVGEHVARYDAVHVALTAALAAIDKV